MSDTLKRLGSTSELIIEIPHPELVDDECVECWREESHRADTDPNYDPTKPAPPCTHKPPLVAGGYIDDQSKWYDGTGEWLLYALVFLSGFVLALVALYALEFWL
tara:strand:+ start:255 stop:569 length:315 start_codon:yes stop_codon:yes gene_type:complete